MVLFLLFGELLPLLLAFLRFVSPLLADDL
jgi:hypothetical protein